MNFNMRFSIFKIIINHVTNHICPALEQYSSCSGLDHNQQWSNCSALEMYHEHIKHSKSKPFGFQRAIL